MCAAWDDGKLGEATEHEAVAVAPVEFLHWYDESELREPRQQRCQCELSLHPRERCTEAVMDAVTESEMTCARAIQLEQVAVRVLLTVAVGGGERDDDLR